MSRRLRFLAVLLLFGAAACSSALPGEAVLRDAPSEQLPAFTAQLERRLAEAPRDADALRLLALIELRQGRPEVAARRALEAVRLAPFVGGHYAVLGEAYEAEQRFARALEAYAQAIALEPDLLPVYVRYARLQVTLKDRETALKSLQEVLRREPRHFAARLLQARLRFDEGDHTGAREAVELARVLRPDDPEALRLHVEILQGAGQVAAAVLLAEQGLGAHPDDPGLLAALARLHRQRADWGAAQTVLERLRRLGAPAPPERLLHVDVLTGMGRAAEAGEALAALLREAPGYAPAYARRAEQLARAGQARQALLAGQQATALAPHLPEGHYWTAVAHYLLEDPALGDAALGALERIVPTSRAARMLRVERLLAAFRLDAAAPLLEALRCDAPDAPELPLLLSAQAALEGDRELAAELLERLPPTFAPEQVRFARLRLAYLDGRWAEADALAEPLAAHPLLGWRAGYLRGAALLRLGRPREAQAVVLPLLQGSPRRIELYHLAGYLHLLLGEALPAQRMFLAGLAQAPGHPLMLDGLSRMAMDAEDWPRAVDLLEQALRAPEADQPLFLERLIQVAQRRKDARLTRSALERYLHAADPARQEQPRQPAAALLYGAFIPDFDLYGAL